MTKQKVGLVLFWLGVVGLFINFISYWFSNPLWRVTTPETVIGTGWAPGEFLYLFASMSLFIGLGISIIGVLLYSGKKGSFFWLWVLVPLIAFPLLLRWQPSQYLPPVYGIGGGIITLAYIGVL